MTESEPRCANCSRLVKVQIYSAGLSDAIPFTCTGDSTVLTIATWDRILDSILGASSRSLWTDKEFRKVESRLIGCPCGGTFRHDVMPKCPNCGAALRVRARGASWFWVVGRMIDGEKQSPWRQ